MAYLEGRLEGHASTAIDVRTGLSHLDVKIESVESRLTTRVDEVESRLTAQIDRQFNWLVGIEITVVLALVGALLRA